MLMGEILGTSIIREKGQITMPQKVREYLGLKQGDKISIIIENGKILIKKAEMVHKDFIIKD